MRVGVIGLGSMGSGAARRLAAAGLAVFGCDPRPAARDALAAEGGTATATASGLPGDLAVCVVFVVNAAQAEAVLFGPERVALAPGAVVLGCTTLAPEAARNLAARLDAIGVTMLDTPVSGGAVAAEAGTMVVMGSGPAAGFDAARPVLDAIAGRVWRLGEAVGVGSTVKMVNQLLAGVHIATAAEALALGIRAGADPRTLFEVISASAGSSWMWQNRVPHILDADDTPRSAVVWSRDVVALP